nr:MAG TPA: hypothetical protein [Caudoviricetes sp.]
MISEVLEGNGVATTRFAWQRIRLAQHGRQCHSIENHGWATEKHGWRGRSAVELCNGKPGRNKAGRRKSTAQWRSAKAVLSKA